MEFAQGAPFGCYTARLFPRTAKGIARVHVSGALNEIRPLNKIFIARVHILYSLYVYIALAFCMPRDYKRAENCQELNILISDVTNGTPAAPITSLIVERKRIKKRKDSGKFGRMRAREPCMSQHYMVILLGCSESNFVFSYENE